MADDPYAALVPHANADPYAALTPSHHAADPYAALEPPHGVHHVEVASDAQGKPRRASLLRRVGEELSVPLSLGGAAWESVPRGPLTGWMNWADHPTGNHLARAVDILRHQGPAALNAEYDPVSDAALTREGVDPQTVNPYLRAAAEFAGQWYNPGNLAAGRTAGILLGGLSKGVRAARAASPAVDAAASAAENVTTKPLGRATRAVGHAAGATAGKVVRAAEKVPGVGPTIAASRAFVSRYAPLRERGGTRYVGAGLAAQAAPQHAEAQVIKDTAARFGGLTRAQKIEVQRLSYVDADGARIAQRNPSVPEPRRGLSLEARGAGVRADFQKDDVLQDQLQIRSEDRGELYDSGTFYPMRERGRPVYDERAQSEGDPLARGEVNAVDAEGRLVRRRGAFSAGVTKGGHKLNDTILGHEDELHPEYDPAHQYQVHRIESNRAIANELSRRDLEHVPLTDQATGEQRWWTQPGTETREALAARVPLRYALERPGGDIALGGGEEGAKNLQRYVEATASARAKAAARQDPAIAALADAHGINPAELGTRRVVARSMAPYDARLAASRGAQTQIAKLATKATQDVVRSAQQRAKDLAKTLNGLDRVKQSLMLGNDALGTALRENGTLREALASNVQSQREAANAVLTELQDARASIAAQRPGNVRDVAGGMAEEHAIAQQPFWDALQQVGGKIVPDVVWDAGKKKFVLAGEFAGMPRSLLAPLKAIPKPDEAGRALGNLDQVTAIVRKTHPDITDSEVREFFTRHPRPPRAGDFADDARERVLAEVLPKYRNAGADQIENLRRDLQAARKGRDVAAGAERGARKATGSLTGAIAQMRTAAARASGASGAIDAAGDALRGTTVPTGGEAAALERIGALDRKARVSLDAQRRAADEVRNRGEVAQAFRKTADRYYAEVYDTVKQRAEASAIKMPEGYVRESSLGLASPSGREMALDDSFAQFFKGAERLSPRETEQAGALWRAFQVLNRLARASIVLMPTVHGINNEGMHYLAEGAEFGATPERMAAILAGRVKFAPELEARAVKAGAVNEYAHRAFGGALGETSAHATTTAAGELAGEIGAKAGPFAGVVKPVARAAINLERGVTIPERIGGRANIPGKPGTTQTHTGTLGTTTVTIGATPEIPARLGVKIPLLGGKSFGYQPMNEWLWQNAERGYAIDLFDRFTKAGMSDDAAAIRVRNTLGKYGDISPREIQANLDRLFYFLPWMKTVVPFWTRKGIIDPKWWEAPERAIEVNNQAQGYDDPSRPFTATLGRRKNGDFRRVVVPLPQRVLEPVAALARLPVDVAHGDFQGVREDAAAPVNYVAGHASLPLSLLLDALQAAQGGGRSALPPWNTFASNPQDPGWKQAAAIAGKAAGHVLAPIEAAGRVADDPLGGATTYVTGGFPYGVEPAEKKRAEHAVRVEFGPLIKAAQTAKNQRAVDRLIAQRDEALRAVDARFVQR